jgi:hypothetical protein
VIPGACRRPGAVPRPGRRGDQSPDSLGDGPEPDRVARALRGHAQDLATRLRTEGIGRADSATAR